ncbi:MAG: sulfate permease [Agitococcus sp.]|nr:sulfate permease [Agitococcus sp.]
MKHLLPAWLQNSEWRQHLHQDIIAGLVVGIVVIPQSLGYALLAGLPPVYGLYAAIVPVLVYALIGASNTQAVGPVAITSIMTAQALVPFAQSHSSIYIALAAFMALLVGVILLFAALLKLGWIMQFISRGVMAAFITGAAVLIITGQIKYILGVSVQGDTLPHLLYGFWQQQEVINTNAVMIGMSAVLLLSLNRLYTVQTLSRLNVSTYASNLVSKLIPIIMLIAASLWVYQAQLFGHIAVVGVIPAGLPSFVIPQWPAWQQWQALFTSALLIALIAFISSASVAKSVALQRQEHFDANKELLGLGLANITAAFFKGLPITGGFSRTAVNVEAGAKTPLAGVFSALVMALVLLVASDWFYYLPLAVLGAGVIVAVSNLLDLQTLKMAWHSDKTEAGAYLVTLMSVLLFGLQLGLLFGLFFSIAALIWRSHQPHMAVVGQVGETEHFRNILRHQVTTWPTLLLIRIDENLFFGNSDSIANRIWQEIEAQPRVKNVVLIFSAVNHVDLSSQWMLQRLEQQLSERYIQLHIAEMKGFVMDVLANTPFIQQWRGQIFLTTEQAANTLKPADPELEYNL